MLYLSSQSVGDGKLTVSVVFKAGTNVEQAQSLVQNRVAVAEARLPDAVRRLGLAVKKASPDQLMVVLKGQIVNFGPTSEVMPQITRRVVARPEGLPQEAGGAAHV